MHHRGLGACLAPVMIANFLPYVLHFVHRGRKFASSTGTIQARGVPGGTGLNGGVLKQCAPHGQQWQRQCAPHLHKGGDVSRTGFVFGVAAPQVD